MPMVMGPDAMSAEMILSSPALVFDTCRMREGTVSRKAERRPLRGQEEKRRANQGATLLVAWFHEVILAATGVSFSFLQAPVAPPPEVYG